MCCAVILCMTNSTQPGYKARCSGTVRERNSWNKWAAQQLHLNTTAPFTLMLTRPVWLAGSWRQINLPSYHVDSYCLYLVLIDSDICIITSQILFLLLCFCNSVCFKFSSCWGQVRWTGSAFVCVCVFSAVCVYVCVLARSEGQRSDCMSVHSAGSSCSTPSSHRSCC